MDGGRFPRPGYAGGEGEGDEVRREPLLRVPCSDPPPHAPRRAPALVGGDEHVRRPLGNGASHAHPRRSTVSCASALLAAGLSMAPGATSAFRCSPPHPRPLPRSTVGEGV